MTTMSANIIDLERESRHFISAIENDRARLAQELHDDVAQRVAMNAIEVRLLYDRVPAGESEFREHVLKVHRQLVQISNDVGRLSHRLHPSIVKHLGVVAAIRSECDNFARLTGTPVRFDCHCHMRNLAEPTGLALFRITQEALRNIAKHAAKSNVHVTLERIEPNLRLCVEDDGGGFDAGHCRPGLGLLSMRERAKLASGTLTIHSSPGHGTRVEAVVPLATVNGQH